jgi:hypothetical protein
MKNGGLILEKIVLNQCADMCPSIKDRSQPSQFLSNFVIKFGADREYRQ